MRYNITIEEDQAEVIKSLAGKINGIKGFQNNKEHRLKLLAKNRKEMARKKRNRLSTD